MPKTIFTLWKKLQSPVNDPTAAGTDVTFISGISQDSKGVINPSKKTVRTMSGASSSAAGTTGLVPAPSSGSQNKVLSGDGTWKDMFNLIYPVGSIYMSVNSTSPATMFGGTWEQIKGEFLYACEDSGITGGTSGGAKSQSYTPAGSVGNHTLTTAEMPSHAHGLNSHVHSVGAHNHGLNSHVHSVGAHAHGLNSHVHGLNEHVHSVGAHAHGLNSHVHGLNEHVHSVGAHAHGLNSHYHSVGEHSHGLNSHTHGVGTYAMDNQGSHDHTMHYGSGANKIIYAAAVANGSKFTCLSTNDTYSDTQWRMTAAGSHKHKISGSSGAASGSTANSSAFNTGNATGNTANSTAFNSGKASGNTAAASGNTANSTAFNSGKASGNTAAASGNTAKSSAFDSGAASGNTANSTAFNSGAASGDTASSGSGGAHNHGFTGTAATISTMPPYLAVYVWKRTA